METTNNGLCEFCRNNKSKYTCPQCNIPYCSLTCYRSEGHANCSESFYQKCVIEEVSCNDNDGSSKQRIVEALSRIQNIDDDDDENDSDTLDSDDDTDCASLSERLKGVNLDDSKEVWKRLKDDERQQFKALLRSGDINSLVEEWQPWWLYQDDKIQELDKIVDHKSSCPKIKEDIKPFGSITTKEPAECVRYSLINIIGSYTFTCRYFNGCQFDFVDEAVNYIVLFSTCLKDNLNFQYADSAINSVCEECSQILKISSNTENLKYVEEDVSKILQGPNVPDKNCYLLCALSDIHNLLEQFIKRKSLFLRHNKSDHLKKNKIKLYIKKIEYFLSYVLYYTN